MKSVEASPCGIGAVGATGAAGAIGAGAYIAVAGAGAGAGIIGAGAGSGHHGSRSRSGDRSWHGVCRNGGAARSQQGLHFVFRHALFVDIDELISREGVNRTGVLDVGQNHFFAQAGLDQLDDILNSGREAWRRLGRTMDGRRLQDQTGNQTGKGELLPHSKQTPGNRRVIHIRNNHADRVHLNNLPHLRYWTLEECRGFPRL